MNMNASDWYYLSFATAERFLGAAVVKAEQMREALFESNRLNINPGGEVLGFGIPVGFVPPPEARERLLTKEEVRSFWPDAERLGDIEAEEQEAIERLTDEVTDGN